jgi:hypothetical protein
MERIMKRILIAFVALLCTVPALAMSEKPVRMSNLPPAVQKAIHDQVAATGATIKKTSFEVEGGKTNYECESVRPNGKKQDFDVSPEGKLGEVEDEVALTEVPAPVKATVDKATTGGGTIKELVSVTVDGKIVGYEASVTRNGKTKGYEMKPDGTPTKD